MYCMKHKAVLFVILTLMSGIAAAKDPAKPRIAVIGFSEKGGHRIGTAAEDWFVDELVKTGKFTVMERDKINSILQEHRLQISGAVDQHTAVKAGKVLGIQLAVYGNVDYAEKSDGVHSSGMAVGGVKIPWGSGKRRTGEGNLTVRLVNVQTGEIVFSGQETVTDSSFNISVMGTGGGSNWDQTKARKVFQPAVAKLVDQIVDKSADVNFSIAGPASGPEGKVVRIKGDEVFINLGSLDGVKAGEEYYVLRGEEIVDPDTKQVLGRDETTVGALKINKVLGDHLATGKISAGAEAKQGDVVKHRK